MKPLNRNFLKIEENSKFEKKNRHLLIHNVASRCELKKPKCKLDYFRKRFRTQLGGRCSSQFKH